MAQSKLDNYHSSTISPFSDPINTLSEQKSNNLFTNSFIPITQNIFCTQLGIPLQNWKKTFHRSMRSCLWYEGGFWVLFPVLAHFVGD